VVREYPLEEIKTKFITGNSARNFARVRLNLSAMRSYYRDRGRGPEHLNNAKCSAFLFGASQI